MVGLVNGLYATNTCSGGIVPIQLTGNYNGLNAKINKQNSCTHNYDVNRF